MAGLALLPISRNSMKVISWFAEEDMKTASSASFAATDEAVLDDVA